jgi:hypothetical protein
MWYTIVALVCLVIVILWNPVYENMTNAAVMQKEEHNTSKPTKWVMPNAEDTKEKLKPRSGKGSMIYGPRAPPLDPNDPIPASDANTSGGSMVYPDIYGPELTAASGGSKQIKQGAVSNSSEPPDYDFVPAAEFPAGPSEPAPYLNDFSKILNK